MAQKRVCEANAQGAVADNATNPNWYYRGDAGGDSLMKLGGFRGHLKICDDDDDAVEARPRGAQRTREDGVSRSSGRDGTGGCSVLCWGFGKGGAASGAHSPCSRSAPDRYRADRPHEVSQRRGRPPCGQGNSQGHFIQRCSAEGKSSQRVGEACSEQGRRDDQQRWSAREDAASREALTG
jgi:hypothetical protein